MITRRRRKRQRPGGYRGNEQGQSLVEASITLIFLLLLVIAIFEMAQVFSTYLVLVNSVRDGAIYAASHAKANQLPQDVEMLQRDPTYQPNTYCTNPNNPSLQHLNAYCERVKQGILIRGLDPQGAYLTILDPVFVPTTKNTAGFTILVGAEYRLTTLFTSSISLPLLGRMGLPSQYTVSYTMEVDPTAW
ncbi:MAG: pilus assembly protein [Ardenticatenia bacterium]|nr:pilus assembly protein [Ardenticatenia bacterium]